MNFDDVLKTGVSSTFIGVESKRLPDQGYKKRKGRTVEATLKELHRSGIGTIRKRVRDQRNRFGDYFGAPSAAQNMIEAPVLRKARNAVFNGLMQAMASSPLKKLSSETGNYACQGRRPM